jgi:ribosome-binding factor A
MTPLTINAGTVSLVRLIDAADRADLAALEARLRAQGHPSLGRSEDAAESADHVVRLKLSRQQAVDFDDPPLLARLGRRELVAAGKTWSTQAFVRIYSFGTLSLVWRVSIPTDTPIAELEALAAALADVQRAEEIDAQMADDTAAALRALAPNLVNVEADSPHDTFTIFELASVSAGQTRVSASALSTDPRIASLLLGENKSFSAATLAGLRNSSISYTDDDLVVIGFDRALVYDAESAADVVALLEVALAQDLALTWSDNELDERAAQLRQRLARRKRVWWRPSPYGDLQHDLVLQHMELTEVLDRIEHAVNLTEDFYYATVYREAVKVFGITEHAAVVQRKLDALHQTATLLNDEVATRVGNRLEWIIIVLIAFEIVWSLTGH